MAQKSEKSVIRGYGKSILVTVGWRVRCRYRMRVILILAGRGNLANSVKANGREDEECTDGWENMDGVSDVLHSGDSVE